MRLHWSIALAATCALIAGCGDKPPPVRGPDYIVDLSPPLNEVTVLKQYGHKATDFFGLKSRSEVTRVRPEDEWRTYGFTYFDILSHGGAHLDASARLMREGQKPDEIPLDRLFGLGARPRPSLARQGDADHHRRPRNVQDQSR